MRSFSNFSDNYDLNESLNSPIEFYATADTHLPDEIYASFDIKMTTYVMSLVKSNVDGVFMLDFGRLLNTSKKRWSFKTTSDIRPAISTLIRFLESSMAFINTQVKGVVITVPNKIKTERFNKFMTLVVKKTFMSKFRSVDISVNVDKTPSNNNKSKKEMTMISLDQMKIIAKAIKDGKLKMNATPKTGK